MKGLKSGVAAVVPIVALLACAAGAHAGIPFTVASGNSPDIAVGADGTAHVAWYNGDALMYCQVRRGATGCAAPPVSFAAPLSPEPASAHVFLAGGSNVLLTTTRC